MTSFCLLTHHEYLLKSTTEPNLVYENTQSDPLFAGGQPTWTETAGAAAGCSSVSEAAERHSKD